MALLNVLAQWVIIALSIGAWAVGVGLLFIGFPRNYVLFKPLQVSDSIRSVAARLSGRVVCLLIGAALLAAPFMLFAPVQWGATLFR